MSKKKAPAPGSLTPFSFAQSCARLRLLPERPGSEESNLSVDDGVRIPVAALLGAKPSRPFRRSALSFASSGRHSTVSVSVAWPPSSPAPSSRGPLIRRRFRPGRSSELCSHRWDRIVKRRASFRMPSDETLRVTLVCTPPLLLFSPSLVAVRCSSAPAVRRISSTRVAIPSGPSCPLRVLQPS